MEPSFPALVGCSETPSQSDMAPQPMAFRSNGENDSPPSKRKKPSSDTELEPEHPGGEQPPSVQSSSSGTAARVIPAARASSVNRQLQRRRQRRQSHSNEGSLAKTLEGVTCQSPPVNGETTSSAAGQHAPAPAPAYHTVPAVGPGGASNATCFLCRGPAYPGRQVELLASDHGGFPSPSARTWVPGLSSDIVTSGQQGAYSLQPAMRPTTWQPANTSSAQFHIPRFPVGLAGNDQVDAAAAWPIDPYDGPDGSSYSGILPGFSEHAVPFPPVPGVLDPHAQGVRAYGRHPVAEESVPVPWSFDGGLTGGGNGTFGPAGAVPGSIPSEWLEVRPASGN